MTDMTHEFSPELPESFLARPQFSPAQRDLSPELPEGFVTAAQVPVNTDWNYAIKSLILRGETSVLGGPSNSGKSAFVGLVAHAIVAGEPFAGHRTKQGLVVHVAAEAPPSVIDRARAYADETDLRTQARYIICKSAIDLSSIEQVSKLLSQMDSIARSYCEPISLIVFDTLILSIGTQDENSSAAMSLVVESAKRIARVAEDAVLRRDETIAALRADIAAEEEARELLEARIEERDTQLRRLEDEVDCLRAENLRLEGRVFSQVELGQLLAAIGATVSSREAGRDVAAA